jgi:phosphoserine aminotransferase
LDNDKTKDKTIKINKGNDVYHTINITTKGVNLSMKSSPKNEVIDNLIKKKNPSSKQTHNNNKMRSKPMIPIDLIDNNSEENMMKKADIGSIASSKAGKFFREIRNSVSNSKKSYQTQGTIYSKRIII